MRLSQQQREAAQRRKRRKASKRQQQVQADTLSLAGWVLLVTTLPAEQWTDQQVLCLYQARWQSELVFKRIKRLLGQHRLRCTTAATAQPSLTALLLGWALLEEESSAVRLAMREAMTCMQQAAEVGKQVTMTGVGCQDGPLSEWLLAEVCVDLFCQQIRGSSPAARYRACWPRLQRFLCTGHRQRPHLYSLVCRWLGMPVAALGERTVVS